MRRMFYLKISDVNKDTTLELHYDGFRNFIGDRNTLDKYHWTIKDLTETVSTMLFCRSFIYTTAYGSECTTIYLFHNSLWNQFFFPLLPYFFRYGNISVHISMLYLMRILYIVNFFGAFDTVLLPFCFLY